MDVNREIGHVPNDQELVSCFETKTDFKQLTQGFAKQKYANIEVGYGEFIIAEYYGTSTTIFIRRISGLD